MIRCCSPAVIFVPGIPLILTKLPAITQYTNCNTPTAMRKMRKASSSFTRCGVWSTYLFQTPRPMFCRSCALRTWPLLLLLLVVAEEGLLAARVGCPEADVTPAVGLAALVGMAEGEGVVEMFFLGAMVGLVV